jgi:hypothetical protein
MNSRACVGLSFAFVCALAAIGRVRSQTAAPANTGCATAVALGTGARLVIDTPHGVREFDRTTRIDWSGGARTMEVELWGGGGGGGGGSLETYAEGGAGGGGGASGAYARGTIAVPQAPAILAIVGSGGRGGAVGQPGLRGGDSTVCVNGTVVLVAAGGDAGQGASTNARGAEPGRGRPDNSGADNVIVRAGHDGARGSSPLFEYRGPGGRGGSAAGSFSVPGSFGGNGGAGEMRPEKAGAGSEGGVGHVLFRW